MRAKGGTQPPVPVGGRHTRYPHRRLHAGSCSFNGEETWRCGSYLEYVSMVMTWELALAVCVSTQSHAEWQLCMCVLTHVGAAPHEMTPVIRASAKW